MKMAPTLRFIKNLTFAPGLLLLLVISSCKEKKVSPFEGVYTDSIHLAYWHEGKRCAFTFTFDDNTSLHKDIGDLLSSYKFRGSFYVNTGLPSFAKNREIYRKLSENGHEIGNHTLNHKNLLTLKKTGSEKEVYEGASAIEQQLGKYPLSFVHPHNAALDSVDSIVFNYHLFSRIASPYNLVNRKIYDVNSQWPAFDDLKSVIESVEKHWIIIAGHGYGENDVRWGFLDSICKVLSQHPDVWVGTLSTVGAYDYIRNEVTISKKVINDFLVIEVGNFISSKYEKLERLPVTIQVPVQSDKIVLRPENPDVMVKILNGAYYFSFDLKKVSQLRIRKL